MITQDILLLFTAFTSIQIFLYQRIFKKIDKICDRLDRIEKKFIEWGYDLND